MPTEPFHRLFFAIRPPAELVPRIARLRDSFGRTANVVSDAHLHLTAWLFPDSQDFPADAVRRAGAAVESIALTAFRIALGRMTGGDGHVALLPDDPPRDFMLFQARLDRALRAAGLTPRPGWRFAPHLTLLYGRQAADAGIDALRWTARELVLIDSVVGQRLHDVVARWAMG